MMMAGSASLLASPGLNHDSFRSCCLGRSTSSTFLSLPKGQGQNRIQRPASGSWMENPFCTNAPHDSLPKLISSTGLELTVLILVVL